VTEDLIDPVPLHHNLSPSKGDKMTTLYRFEYIYMLIWVHEQKAIDQVTYDLGLDLT